MKTTKESNSHQINMDDQRVLGNVPRPQMALEALQMLRDGIEIEVPNNKVFDFLRATTQTNYNIKINCVTNKYHHGWTALVI